ncbi:RND transporter [Myxococcota bacterium]|nr:RND transporter [Myxococcota bacterium]
MSYSNLMMIALLLGLSPFLPEPHLFEKLRMLKERKLKKPIDIFDLLMHATPLFLLAIKFTRDWIKA